MDKRKKLIETFIDIIHQSTWEQYWWENEIPIVLVYQTLQHQHNQILNHLFIVQDLPTSLIGHIIPTKDILGYGLIDDRKNIYFNVG